MYMRFSQLRNSFNWKYLLILIPFASVYLFILIDAKSTGNVKAKVNSVWVSLGSSREPPLRMPSSVPLDEMEEYVAFCVAVKDQHLDLHEFLVHHYYHMGVRRFYIMDDGSDPPLSTVTDYGIPNSAITFQYFEPELTKDKIMQASIYNECVSNWGSNHTWMAFIDADEFYHTPGSETFTQVLKSFEDDNSVGALGVNWRTHTSNGLLERPPSSRQHFTDCIIDGPSPNGTESDNLHIKSIVKTAFYVNPQSPHSFWLKDDAKTVGEKGDVIDSPPRRNPVTRDRIGLHHFAVKSKAEYAEKINRSNANKVAKGWDWWDHIEVVMPHQTCREMTMYDP